MTSIDDLPTTQLCAQQIGNGAVRWDNACQGSIVVVQSLGPDCEKYWLFDATAKALQATAAGCNGSAYCTGSAPRFTFPSGCFDGNFETTVTRLCAADGGYSADSGAADGGSDSAGSGGGADASDAGVACGAGLSCGPNQVCARRAVAALRPLARPCRMAGPVPRGGATWRRARTWANPAALPRPARRRRHRCA